MVLDSGAVFMDQVDGEGAGDGGDSLDQPRARGVVAAAAAAKPRHGGRAAARPKASHNGLPAQSDGGDRSAGRRSSSSALPRGGAAGHRPPLCRPLSLDMTPRGSRDQVTERRFVQPPWRSGLAAPSPPARSLTSPSLGAGGWMRRSESTCSVNYSLGRQAGRAGMRPATSLPHIAKGPAGGSPVAAGSKPCLLVALRPLNLEQEKQAFFESDFKYEPQFEYMQPEPRAVLDKYQEGSGLFLEQVHPPPPPPPPGPRNTATMTTTIVCLSAGSRDHGVCPEEVWLLREV